MKVTQETATAILEFCKGPTEEELLECYQFLFNCLPEEVYRKKLFAMKKWLLKPWQPLLWICTPTELARFRAMEAATKGASAPKKKKPMNAKPPLGPTPKSPRSASIGSKKMRDDLLTSSSSSLASAEEDESHASSINSRNVNEAVRKKSERKRERKEKENAPSYLPSKKHLYPLPSLPVDQERARDPQQLHVSSGGPMHALHRSKSNQK